MGDSVGSASPHFGRYPKSGHVANRTARSVARYIAMQARDQDLSPILIDHRCHLLVHNSPREAISVQFDCKIGEDGRLHRTRIDDNERRTESWASDQTWAGSMFDDMAAGSARRAGLGRVDTG